jgi:hypothetical protein
MHGGGLLQRPGRSPRREGVQGLGMPPTACHPVTARRRRRDMRDVDCTMRRRHQRTRISGRRTGASKGARDTLSALPDCTPVAEPLGLGAIMTGVPVPGVGAAVPVMPLMSFWGCTLKLIPGVPVLLIGGMFANGVACRGEACWGEAW